MHMTFSYINQSGDIPLGKTGFIISGTFMAVVCIGVGVFGGRFVVRIDDKFAIFRTDFYVFLRIPITKIKDVSIEHTTRVPIGGMYFFKKNIEKLSFDFVRQTVSMKMKSGKVYQIAIKNAKTIREEIEKRMITNKIASS